MSAEKDTPAAERWWISDGVLAYGGAKILGPFESRDLALDVRSLYEAHPRANGQTFWVSQERDADAAVTVYRCPRRQCRGRLPHSRLVHWFGWLRR